jgi:hypothetical protein
MGVDPKDPPQFVHGEVELTRAEADERIRREVTKLYTMIDEVGGEGWGAPPVFKGQPTPDVLVNDAAVLRFCPNLRCNRPLGVRMHIEHEDEETVGWKGTCSGCGREFLMSADKVQWESSDGRVPAGD